MNCEVCKRPKTLLFTSWACDYCDGKLDETGPGLVFDDVVASWLALHTPEGKEISGPGYRRVRVAADSAKWFMGTAEFPTATGEWGIVHSAALMDAEEGGNMLYVIHLAVPAHVSLGSAVKISC